jgi:hypothetical protein
VLKLAIRGSLKTKPILLTIALFIAINVGIHAMASSYEAEATNLISLYVGQSYVSVSENPTPNAIRVAVSPTTIQGKPILLISTQSFQELLKLSEAWLQGKPPVNPDEISVGEALTDLVTNNAVAIDGRSFKVTGSIRSNSHVAYSIVSTTPISQAAKIYYLSSTKSPATGVSAPAAVTVSRSVFSEVLTIASLASYLLYGVLALSCLFQGYNSLIEAEETMQVFVSIGAPKGLVNKAMLLYACVLSLAGTMLGLALGTFLPGLSTSIASIAFKLPHIKPFINPQVALDLVIGFFSSLLALTTGLLGGYTKEIATA